MRSAAILLLVSSGLWAQRNVTSPAGFGRILYPGGGPPASVGVGFVNTPVLYTMTITHP